MVHCKVTLNVLQIDNQLLTSDIVLCLCDHLQQTKTVMYLCSSILYTFCRFYFVSCFVIYEVIDMHIASSYYLYIFILHPHLHYHFCTLLVCVLCKLLSIQRNVSKTTSTGYSCSITLTESRRTNLLFKEHYSGVHQPSSYMHKFTVLL